MKDKLNVLITTSGIGSRLGDFTKYSNKCLVRVGDMPIITRIINSYSADTCFFITLGHNGDLVKQYLNIAHPSNTFVFIEVENYKEKGSSLAHSMLKAESFLQKPFIYHACDTLTEAYVPSLDYNWCGGYEKMNSSHYTTLNVEGTKIKKINPKGEINYDFEYIGLCGIRDYKLFWKTLNEFYQNNPNDPTLNDSIAINSMLKSVEFKILQFNKWSDIGNIESLNQTRVAYPATHTVLDKDREAIYFLQDRVVKFFKDVNINKKRVDRIKHLNGLVPNILDHSNNFYSYKYEVGDLAADVIDEDKIIDLLNWANNNLWSNCENLGDQAKDSCRNFYFNKTSKRVAMLLSQINKVDGKDTINNKEVPSIKDMMSLLGDNFLLNEWMGHFHGDFILDNILVTPDGFKLIDWRQDFDGSIEFGDVYYDLAKLNHNLFFNHHNIQSGLYDIVENDGRISVDLKTNYRLFLVKQKFDQWCTENGFDINKINILTSIIWINMAPLHEYPLNKFLFYFGKFNLKRGINEIK